MGSRGLLQLFYCTNSERMCEDEHGSYSPFGEAVVARVVEGEEGCLWVGVGYECADRHEVVTAVRCPREESPLWAQCRCNEQSAGVEALACEV